MIENQIVQNEPQMKDMSSFFYRKFVYGELCSCISDQINFNMSLKDATNGELQKFVQNVHLIGIIEWTSNENHNEVKKKLLKTFEMNKNGPAYHTSCYYESK